MTENTTNNTTSDTDQSKESAEPITPKSQTSPKNTLSLVAIAVGAVAIGLSGWNLYQQRIATENLQPITQQLSKVSESQDSLNQQVTQQGRVSQSLPAIQKKQREHDSLLKELQDNLEGSQTQVTQQNSKLVSLGQQLNRIGNTTKEDWKLAETEYLIRLANQRLLMENDITGAENLLSSADQILGEMADPILFETRKAIAKDIQALKATSSFDTEGLYLQLDALASQINKLPQREPSTQWQKNNASENDSLDNSERSIQSVLSELLASVKSLVVINYDHKPIKALLPAADYQELVSSIQIQISVAQLALLKKQNTIYQTALKHVVEAVSTHFEIKAKPVVAFITSITALQQINPEPELPLPRDSLAAIKKLMTEWQSLSLNNAQKSILQEEIVEDKNLSRVGPAEIATETATATATVITEAEVTPKTVAEPSPTNNSVVESEEAAQSDSTSSTETSENSENSEMGTVKPQTDMNETSQPKAEPTPEPTTDQASETPALPKSDAQSNIDLNEVSA